MPRFSANLGFLWTELPLPEAIRAAARAGFEAVECHFPYGHDPGAVRAALEETGLPMLGLNTVRGDVAAGEFGLAALPGRREEARAAIDEAVAYAAAIGCRNVHVMAGRSGEGLAQRRAFLDSLAHACDRAAARGIGILIEPINRRDAPDYHLSMVEDAAEIVEAMGKGGPKLMFDCYHVQVSQGDLTRRLEKNLGAIGHVQIAAAPSRAEPDEGEIAYDRLLGALDAMAYDGFVGAEYRPRASTEAGLAWLRAYRRFS